ncbi:MAG TPA: hypothetical protein VD968_06320, partial [Pyrinomonadaceae bacterium]|nr:hypothetical protein [Pyrinomonadaceae bacterium]
MRSHPQALAAALACAASLALFAAAPAPRAQKLAANSAAASYSALEQEVIRELNLARTRPADYAAHLEELRALFSGRELRRPGRVALVTEEGPAALEEAIRFLRAARPLPPL